MSSEFEKALMGLDFGSNLPETSSKNVVYSIEDKQKRQLSMLKKRIVAVDVLVSKYRDKNFLLSTTENMLSNLKTEYKIAREESQETCKNYKSVHEKCTLLEGEISMLKSKCNQLELEALRHESNKGAAQSYTKQLQELVKERDSTIEALKIENNLVKDSTVVFQKKINKLNKIITALTRNLATVADVVFIKRPLNKREKLALYKYMQMNKMLSKKKNKERICELLELEPNSDNESVVFEDTSEPEETGLEAMINSSTIDETANSSDSDNAVSEDTGRGSSLACSDKGFLSPTYSIVSPHSVESVKNKDTDSLAHTTPFQSPKTVKGNKKNATKPVKFQTTQVDSNTKIATPVASSKVFTDQPTRPLKFDSRSKVDVPDIVVTIDDAVNEIELLTSIVGTENIAGVDTLSPVAEKQDSVKNSYLYEEKSNDGESLPSIEKNKERICELLELEPNSDNESVFEDTSEPEETVEEAMINSSVIDETGKGNDSDNAVSEDTGRGSSLACSDKGFLSPTYSIVSPHSVESVKNKDADSLAHTTPFQSPKTVKGNKKNATRPVKFKRTKVNSNTKISTPVASSKVLTDQPTRPLKFDSGSKTNVSDIVVTIDDAVNEIELLTSIVGTGNIDGVDTLSPVAEKQDSVKNSYLYEARSNDGESLPLIGEIENIDGIEPLSPVTEKRDSNKYSNLCDENSNDGEIEMILKNMRVGRDLLTPIPATPARSISRSTVMSKVNRDSQNETAKMREDIAELKNTVKSIMPFANLLQNIIMDEKITNLLQDCIKRNIEKVLEETQNVEKVEISKSNEKRNLKKGNHIQEKVHGKHLQDCTLLDKNPVILNHSHSAQKQCEQKKSIVLPNLKPSQKLLFEDKLSDNEEADEIDVKNTTENIEQSRNKQDKKTTKVKKLTKLEKLRKNLQPKSKIRRNYLASPRKLRSRIPDTKQKKESPAASLDNKEAYERAVKIMAELKSKQKDTKIINTKKDDSKNCINKNVNRICSPNSNKLKANEKSRLPNSGGHDKKRENSISSLKKIEASKRKNSGESQSQIGNIRTRSRRLSTNSNDSITLAELVSPRTRSKRLSTKSNNSITLAEVISPRRDETHNREKSVEGENVGKLSPRKKKSNSNIQKSRKSIEKPDLVCNITRRKSLTPEFDSVKVSNRSKYPSFSLDKDVVVVINQSDIREQIKELENTTLEKCRETETMHRNGSRRSSEDTALEQRKPLLRNRSSTDKTESERSNVKIMRKCSSEDKAEALLPKRVLRSSIQFNPEDKVNEETVNILKSKQNDVGPTAISPHSKETNHLPSIISYTDLDLFSDEPAPKKQRLQDDPPETNKTTNMSKPHESILCRIIEKHGINKLKVQPPKIPEAVVNSVQEKIAKGISQINELPLNNNKQEMNNLVEVMKKLQHKDFLAGLMKYLADPQRKIELYNKITAPPAPPMTKSEQILLYLVMKLKGAWPNVDIVNQVLKYIEYNLFKLNGTPDFDSIDSMAHFYAVLCRYINSKSRLKLFMLDAMYCINFKAIPLIKQCLEVWMHILPLAHMGIANTPLVTCIVYLLHYYKTKEDRFNRVQEIRNILSHRYFFKVTEWNEIRILEMFKNAILELGNKDSRVEKKMLRLALIILAKRQGPRWCQAKIITNLLQPLINQAGVSETAKAFCVSLLGPLVKPYPMDMKVHCEIVLNQLLSVLNNDPSPSVAEAVFESLISINRHNQNRVIQAMLEWHPEKVSPDLENLLKDFVREKPVKYWKTLLRQIYLERQD